MSLFQDLHYYISVPIPSTLLVQNVNGRIKVKYDTKRIIFQLKDRSWDLATVYLQYICYTVKMIILCLLKRNNI